MLFRAKTFLKSNLPRPVYEGLRLAKNPQDIKSALRFATSSELELPVGTRLGVLRRMFLATFSIECPHTQDEVLRFMEAILMLPDSIPGCVIEAGCYKGGSTAKFSLATKLAGRKLKVFDSFEGIPEHEEDHGKNIFGDEAAFPPGSYKGALEEVQSNVERFGDPSVCTYVKGWFDDTLPGFDEPVAAAYLDVDLASSTKTCLKYLYPLLSPGGVLFSQDGHLPLVLDVFRDRSFWEDELGCSPPRLEGLGQSKLIRLSKA